MNEIYISNPKIIFVGVIIIFSIYLLNENLDNYMYFSLTYYIFIELFMKTCIFTLFYERVVGHKPKKVHNHGQTTSAEKMKNGIYTLN